MAQQDAIIGVIKTLFFLLGSGALLWFVIIPLIKFVMQPIDTGSYIPDLPMDLEGEELEIPGQGLADAKPDRQTILDTAKKESSITTATIRAWLREK